MCPRSPELDDLARHAAGLTSGDPDALRELRPALHRVVVAADIAGAVKTLAVQALLLLDDPRLAHSAAGRPLVVKVRKLIDSALAAHESGAAVSAPRAAAAIVSPDALLSPDIDRALVEEFVTEAREQLAVAEAALLVLDSAPDDVEAVDTMFRSLHTIKGTSAFLGVEHATELAHHTESLLARVRNGSAICAGDLSNLLFRAIDMLDAIIVSIETAAEGDVAMLPDGFRPLLEVLRKQPHLQAVASEHTPAVSGAVRRVRAIEPTVRVRMSELDRLAELVRELTLTHAMIARDAALRLPSNAELARKMAHADEVTVELEAMAGELRTIPFGTALQKLVRIARDTAHRGGKLVELVTEGEDVLVERATLEALSDALMHMVRNAIDHGVESAETRERAGKLPAGRLRIAARRSGLELVVEVQDDGRGLDSRRLVDAAVARGMLAPGVELAEQQAFALVLRPGFSTAQIVTDLSGRGVGMDVVRSTVELLGGSISIDSRLGAGTTFTIRLPFRAQRARNADTWGEPPRTIGLIA